MRFDSLQMAVLWGVELWRLVAAVIVVLLGLSAKRIIAFVFRGLLARYTGRTDAKWDDELVKHMPAPVAAIAQIGMWYGAVRLLELPSEPLPLQSYASSGLVVALWGAAAWLLFRLVDVLAGALARRSKETDSRLDDQLVPLLRKTLKVVIALVIFVMAVQNLGYSVTSLVASLGVGGLALALAAKDTVANLFGSVVVFTDRPFRMGDWVQFADVEGTVEEVGFRTTRIRRFDKSLVTVPNSTFSTTPIINHSERPLRRLDMTVGVSYQSKLGQMRELLERLRKLVASHPEIDPGYQYVHFTGFGASSLEVQIYCFTRSTVWLEHLAAREDLMLQIMEVVEELGLEMALPTRRVYLRDESGSARGKSLG